MAVWLFLVGGNNKYLFKILYFYDFNYLLDANSTMLLLGGLDVPALDDVLAPAYVFVKLFTSIVELPAGGLRSGIGRFLR